MTNDTQALALTEFLLARIAEDEALARGAWPDQWEQDGARNAVQTAETGLRGGYEGLHMGVANTAMTVGNYQAEARNAAHIARHDPARVLAECEAKRRIVELQAANDEDRYLPGFHYKAQMIERVLRTLAAPYADHPDYREGWR